MPFIARDVHTNQRIDITDFKDPKIEIPPGTCVCQLCGARMTVRAAHIRVKGQVRAHFAHMTDCNALFDAHPESEEHRTAKLYLRDYLRMFYKSGAVNPTVQLEYPIPMEWRAKGRIADIAVEWPHGILEVHEAQLASITEDEIRERTQDYLRAGCDVTWWIGGKAATGAIRDYVTAEFGYCHVLHFSRSIIQYDSSPKESGGIRMGGTPYNNGSRQYTPDR